MPKLKFKRACQYVFPSDVRVASFDVVGGKLEDFSRDMELIGSKNVDSNGRLELYRSKTYKWYYRYRLTQLRPDWEHEAGYVWSSRASLVNKIFGTKISEIVIYENPCMPCSCSIDADELSALLPAEYEVRRNDRHGEISYEVCLKTAST